MKLSVIACMLLFGMTCKAQDSSRAETAALFMRDNLNMAHTEFRTGTTLALSGAAISIAGSFINTDVKYIPMVAGGLFSIIGTILMIDSHKFIGRAGSWEFTPNSIRYNIDRHHVEPPKRFY